MDLFVASSITAVLVVGAVGVGLIARRRSGRRRRITVADVVAADMDVAELGLVATVVQFSTEYCARCPGLRRALVEAFPGDDGVVYTDVDLTHRPHLASRLRVLQTPTVLVVDAHGHVAARYAGTVSPASIRTEIDALTRSNDVTVAA